MVDDDLAEFWQQVFTSLNLRVTSPCARAAIWLSPFARRCGVHPWRPWRLGRAPSHRPGYHGGRIGRHTMTEKQAPAIGVSDGAHHAGGVRTASPKVDIDVSALTHPGLVRPDNEDQYFVTRLTRTLETMLTSVPASAAPARPDAVNYVMVVADGMGGHAAGEVASRMAISALARLALDLPDWHFRVDPDRTSELAQRTRHIVEQIDAELVEEGRHGRMLMVRTGIIRTSPMAPVMLVSGKRSTVTGRNPWALMMRDLSAHSPVTR
jgi:hypothetical protein